MSKIVGNYAVLDNGTTWHLPRSDDDLIWRCTWAPEGITKNDLIRVASIMSSYQYMVECMTQKERNSVCTELKQLMMEKESGES